MDTQLHRPPLAVGRTARILVGYKTDKGLKRSNNEDSHAVFANGELGAAVEALLVVADGMGGTKGGEIASNIVVNSLPEALQSLLGEGFPSGLADAPARVAPILTQAIRQANGEVWDYKRQHAGLENMGTTCVTAALSEGIVTVGNVGDSRAYLLRAGRLRQITEDHSEVWEQVKAGRMTPEEAATSRFRNTITRAMGLSNDVAPDVTAYPLEEGDALLLCSDGLTTEVDDDTIARLLIQSPDPQAACDRLVAQALRNGGSDNVTVVVMHYGAFAPRHAASALPPLSIAEPIGIIGASGGDDITDRNQAWKQKLPSAAARAFENGPEAQTGANHAGRQYRDNIQDGEDGYARSSRRFHEAAQTAPRRGVSGLLFGLVLLAAIGEGIALSLFWAGHFKARPLAVAPPAIVVKPTDRPLTYPLVKLIYAKKPLWDGLLQIAPDDRLLVVTRDGQKLLVTHGGTATELGDPNTKLPPAVAVHDAESIPFAKPVLPAVAFDASGCRYELNPVTKSIDKYDASGAPLLANIGKQLLHSPAGIAVDKSGSIYVIDSHHLKRIESVPDVGQPAAPPVSAPVSTSPAAPADNAGSGTANKQEGVGQ